MLGQITVEVVKVAFSREADIKTKYGSCPQNISTSDKLQNCMH